MIIHDSKSSFLCSELIIIMMELLITSSKLMDYGYAKNISTNQKLIVKKNLNWIDAWRINANGTTKN